MSKESEALSEKFESLSVRAAGGHLFARPTLSLFLYSDRPVHVLAPLAASVIESYVDFIGSGVLRTVAGDNGDLRDFTPRKLARDLKLLREPPDSLGAAWVEYDSDPEGWVGEFGVYFYATDFKAYEYERGGDNILRLDFPAAFGQRRGMDQVVDFMIRCAALMEFESGNAGLTLKRTSWTKGDAIAGVNRLLPRYLALDPCYSEVKDILRGHTTWAHWINFISQPIVNAVGGLDTLKSTMNGAKITAFGEAALAVQNCELPPLGDKNRRAPDIGLIPAMARLLAPTRVQLSGLGDQTFDTSAWLSRFDDMEVGSFSVS